MLNSHPLCPHLQFKDEFFIFLKTINHLEKKKSGYQHTWVLDLKANNLKMTLKPNQSARIRENKSLEIVFYMGLPLFNEISKILFFFGWRNPSRNFIQTSAKLLSITTRELTSLGMSSNQTLGTSRYLVNFASLSATALPLRCTWENESDWDAMPRWWNPQ